MDFEFVAGNLALDFANTVHSYGEPDPEDDLKTYADLVAWARQAGFVLGPERQGMTQWQASPAAAAVVFRKFVQLRAVVYEIFAEVAARHSPRVEEISALEEYFRDAAAQLVLEKSGRHYELAWQASTPALERVRGDIARAAVDLLTSADLHRVRQCAGENCTWLFVDTSRNGTRRWCDMQACGNRAKVQRFRQRSRA